jgi:hypothetical protein
MGTFGLIIGDKERVTVRDSHNCDTASNANTMFSLAERKVFGQNIQPTTGTSEYPHKLNLYVIHSPLSLKI